MENIYSDSIEMVFESYPHVTGGRGRGRTRAGGVELGIEQ